MADEEGVIISVKGRRAEIKSHRSEACEHCAAKDGCKMMGGGKEMVFEVENTLNAQVGDRVRVTISDRAFLRVVFLIYTVPMFGFFAGLFLGKSLGQSLGFDPSVAAAFSALAGMGLVFAVVRIFAKKMGKDSRYVPSMVRIVGKAGDAPQDSCEV